jgi:hypothetical protein
LPTTSAMYGIERGIWGALSGLDSILMTNPGRCPGLAWHCPFGARDQATRQAPTGQLHVTSPMRPNHLNPGHRPRIPATPLTQAPTGRNEYSPGHRPGIVHTPFSKALKGRSKPLHPIWAALSGLVRFSVVIPGRCPGLAWHCPFGARQGGAA